MDVRYGLFHVWNVERPTLYKWFSACIHKYDNEDITFLNGIYTRILASAWGVNGSYSGFYNHESRYKRSERKSQDFIPAYK